MASIFQSSRKVTAMSFSEKIVSLRKKRNWTQVQLAELLGMAVNQIKRYEKGKSAPSLEAIKKLAITFGISTDELIFDNGDAVASQKLDSELLRRFEKISKLPQKEREAVETVLDGIIIKNQLNDMVANKDRSL
jgi:transcriptional regulator with XRE-family HTH domain